VTTFAGRAIARLALPGVVPVLLACLVAACAGPGGGRGTMLETTTARPGAGPAATTDLIGLRPGELERRLGSPALLRREPPAQVWQYRPGACVLDVFLYERDGGPVVVHLEARDLSAAVVTTAPCLAAQQRRAAAS
jgi:hypothetical protein